MSDDYKKDILNYITNMVKQTEPTTEEIFAYQDSIDRSVWKPYLPTAWVDFRYEGMVAPDETTTGLGVLYGGYIDADNNVKGIITLFDENFEPVKTIYEYSSGTPLRYIQYMKQAEDGTFYFIDDTAFSFSQRQQALTSQKRFVMVNNFTIPNSLTNDYEVNLRTSYIFSGDYVNFYCKNMFKNPNSSHYIFFGDGVDSSSPFYDYRYLKIFSLKINVGQPNEWTMYANLQQKFFGSAFALFDSDDNVMFRCANTSTLNTSRAIECTSKTYTGNVQTNAIATFDFHPYVDDYSYKKQSVFLSMDEVYFVQNNQRWGNSGSIEAKYIGLYKYKFSTNTLTTIYEKLLGNYDFSNIEAIYIDRCDTDIYIQYNNNIVSEGSRTADYYFQRLVNGTWNPILIGETIPFVRDQRTIFVKSNFNLLQVYLYAINPRSATWFQYLIKENYNVLNYNGEPYTDYNSTIPKQARVYNQTRLMFSRNLYNLTINDNQSNATVVVPNSYLNGIDLTYQNLFSETNTGLIYNANTITKNIYETLFLNFITTLNVKDTDTNTNYPTTASYITTNVNTGTQTNCENTFLGKARINFSGGSSRVQTINWDVIDDFNKQTSFALYIAEPISTIDLISDDELVTYMTIDASTMEVNKTYLVTQKLGIE